MPTASATLQASIDALAEPICRAHGLELVQATYVREPNGAVLRVLIERRAQESGTRQASSQVVEAEPSSRTSSAGTSSAQSGVSLEDCQSVSRDLSAALDVHDALFSGRYRLEVSSPGLDRPLVKKADFERFSGREVRIRTKTAIGARRRFSGRLLGVQDQNIALEDDTGASVSIPYEVIDRANLVYRF